MGNLMAVSKSRFDPWEWQFFYQNDLFLRSEFYSFRAFQGDLYIKLGFEFPCFVEII